jgi:hypothetical protein
MIKKSVILDDYRENVMFWVIWLIMGVLMNIIMLKFVIAEIKGVYMKIDKNLEETVLKDRAALCSEVDIMRPSCLKTKSSYPKYIIIREISN